MNKTFQWIIGIGFILLAIFWLIETAVKVVAS